MLLAKALNPLVIGDERTREFDRRGDQQPVGRVAMLKMMEPLAAGGPMSEPRCLDAGTPEKALDPRLDA